MRKWHFVWCSFSYPLDHPSCVLLYSNECKRNIFVISHKENMWSVISLPQHCWTHYGPLKNKWSEITSFIPTFFSICDWSTEWHHWQFIRLHAASSGATTLFTCAIELPTTCEYTLMWENWWSYPLKNIYTTQSKHLNLRHWHQQHLMWLIWVLSAVRWDLRGSNLVQSVWLILSFHDQGSFGFRLKSWALCHVPWPIFEPFLWCARCIVLLGVRLPSSNATAMVGCTLSVAVSRWVLLG